MNEPCQKYKASNGLEFYLDSKYADGMSPDEKGILQGYILVSEVFPSFLCFIVTLIAMFFAYTDRGFLIACGLSYIVGGFLSLNFSLVTNGPLCKLTLFFYAFQKYLLGDALICGLIYYLSKRIDVLCLYLALRFLIYAFILDKIRNQNATCRFNNQVAQWISDAFLDSYYE